ncbi:hypothetical protein ABZ760_08510 [Streptomyces sp. NPDC006658]|uniref:hypothetical protein n=1 Tax=Streptomyces sp. NPDC006658 TaxID=3156900 RepID=UPI0033C221D3
MTGVQGLDGLLASTEGGREADHQLLTGHPPTGQGAAGEPAPTRGGHCVQGGITGGGAHADPGLNHPGLGDEPARYVPVFGRHDQLLAWNALNARTRGHAGSRHRLNSPGCWARTRSAW